MLWGVPSAVKRFFRPVTNCVSKPIRGALPAMVLALLLAPHRRSLKTIAGMVFGHRCHGTTISRRLENPLWQTWEWYSQLYAETLTAIDCWERRDVSRQEKAKRRRRWFVVVDTTYHESVGECMENRIVMSRRKHPSRRTTRHHAFVMGMLLTDRGARLPLPRKSYYTKEYCRAHHRRYQTQPQLAAAMIRELKVPEDVDVIVLFDSGFDAAVVHKACRKRGFPAVFPLDSNRVLAAGFSPEAAGLAGENVVRWTRHWSRKEFAILELQVDNEDYVFARRRHVDNLRVKKTRRRYAVAARRAAVSKLGECLIVASYKENLKVALLPGESAEWWHYHRAPVRSRKQEGHRPSRWHGKVLGCTDPSATAREVIQWYELRWQVELFFRELKSRMQFECYVLMKFSAVERYLDMLLMGFLLLEQQRLEDLKRSGAKAGAPWVHARTTDRLRMLEWLCQEWNVRELQRLLRTARGRRRLLDALRRSPCQVA